MTKTKNDRDYRLTKEYRDEVKKPRRHRKWFDANGRFRKRFDLMLRVGYDDWHQFD